MVGDETEITTVRETENCSWKMRALFAEWKRPKNRKQGEKIKN